MRHFFKKAARALRARREMAVAITTAAVAAVLIIGGQGDLAAIVAAGAAGLMAGRACRYRLTAQELRRQTAELGDELIKIKTYAATEAERHRLEVGSWRRRLDALVKEARGHLAYLERNATSYEWCALRLRWEIKRAEERLARTGLLSEQVQLVDLLPPKDVDEFYASEEDKEVNTVAEE